MRRRRRRRKRRRRRRVGRTASWSSGGEVAHGHLRLFGDAALFALGSLSFLTNSKKPVAVSSLLAIIM
jgi:hypothetical protein